MLDTKEKLEMLLNALWKIADALHDLDNINTTTPADELKALETSRKKVE